MPKLSDATLSVLDAQIQTGAFCGPALLNELLRGYRAHVRGPAEEDIVSVCRVLCCPDGCAARDGDEICGVNGFSKGDLTRVREVIRAWRGRE